MERSAAENLAGGANGRFQTTHWTVVLEAAASGMAESNEPFGQLYLDYWYPLYAYVRRRGYTPHDAEDITQGFFARLFEKQSLAEITRNGGRFRSFLLTSLTRYLSNEWDRTQAQKRGGGASVLPLNTAEAELRYATSAPESASPERMFERNWTFTLLDHVFECVRAECEAGNKGALFDDLRFHLQGDKHGTPYSVIAAKHGVKEGAIKVFVHRLRQRYGELLRKEIGRTVATSGEIDQELRHLIGVVTG